MYNTENDYDRPADVSRRLSQDINRLENKILKLEEFNKGLIEILFVSVANEKNMSAHKYDFWVNLMVKAGYSKEGLTDDTGN